ncbi:MAG: FAD:protein FMN transferase [Oscillospiraceae bacterium]|nr:FAD:protein FMN transferase [Oscillospiraceae bacterium]
MKRIFPLFGIIILCLLCGCGEMRESPYERELFAMDTYMKLTAYGDNPEAALDMAEEKITELEELFSVTLSTSDIGRLNSSMGVPTEVDDQTSALISRSKILSEKTDGAVDITVYPLVREWGFTTGNYSVLSSERTEELLKFTGSSYISVSENTVTIPENFQLDLGSAAKGYAGEKAAEILKEAGISSAIMNLGGNIQTVGEKPDGSPWKVAVTDPLSPSEVICTISVRDKAVVTSGNYQRFFMGEDGRKYCHIIDPKTGRPVDNGLASVTVIGSSGTDCDLLSTALFVMGEESAVEFIKENSGFDMLLITEDGRVIITGNIFNDTEFTEKEIKNNAEVIV